MEALGEDAAPAACAPATALIRKILIANRGEIALRILRAAHELGIETVAVYSEPDRYARHVQLADEAYLLGPAPPAQSYLNAERLLEIAGRSGADAVHPGYGFFSENAAFAQRAIDAGLTWIGPQPSTIEAMGDKVRARQTMHAAGVPIVPGGTRPLLSANDAREAASLYGLPLALKASAGGGGKGLKIARTLDEAQTAFNAAQREAQAYFKNPVVYAERYLENPKHIEIQILADKHGTVLHVGERDCSLQRRHQKLWEESPPAIPASVRTALRETGVAAARAIGYDSVGTIEFLVAGEAFYFLEMNTRIQVEHTVSEMISGLDLVREQIRVAAGESLGYGQEHIVLRGHAIEIRVNAEDPSRDFLPVPGTLTVYQEPAGPGVRVDSAAAVGSAIAPDYDSLIAKLVVWDQTRECCLARLRRAIDEFVIRGVPTTLPLLRSLIDHAPVADTTYGTATLEAFAATFRPLPEDMAVPQTAHTTTLLRDDGLVHVEVNERRYIVRLLDQPGLGGSLPRSRPPHAPRPSAIVSPARSTATSGNDIRSPMHGAVVEIAVVAGASVEAGQVVAIIEAMKMMNEIRAHRAGTVVTVHLRVGETVEPHALLVTLADA